MLIPKRVTILLCASLVAACASEVVRHSSTLTAESSPAIYTLRAPATFRLDSGYSRSLAAGAELAVAGTVPEGRVLKPLNQVLMVEGRHMHEAYLVEKGGRVVGFYLPAEKAFSPLSNPVGITLGETRK